MVDPVGWRRTWTSNRRKRLALTPKRYPVDAGRFVVAQCRAECALMSPMLRLHHLRSREGRENDLVIEVGPQRLVAIEVKAAATRATMRHGR